MIVTADKMILGTKDKVVGTDEEIIRVYIKEPKKKGSVELIEKEGHLMLFDLVI
jgi:hypothetical protein